MTDYLLIYDKAISSFEDPILTQIYNQSKIGFCSKMYTHLSRAIWLFNTPYYEVKKLSDAAVDPQSNTESFQGDGTTTSFVLSQTPSGEGTFLIEATVNGVKASGSYNNGTFVFDTAPTSGSTILISQYLTGGFNTEVSQTELTILALLLVSCWSEKEENFLLDIRRLLTTSDFKLHDSASVLRSKVNWHYTKYEQAQKLMNNYSLTLMKKGVFGG